MGGPGGRARPIDRHAPPPHSGARGGGLRGRVSPATVTLLWRAAVITRCRGGAGQVTFRPAGRSPAFPATPVADPRTLHAVGTPFPLWRARAAGPLWSGGCADGAGEGLSAM